MIGRSDGEASGYFESISCAGSVVWGYGWYWNGGETYGFSAEIKRTSIGELRRCHRDTGIGDAEEIVDGLGQIDFERLVFRRNTGRDTEQIVTATECPLLVTCSSN